MKKILILLNVVLFSFTSFAQNSNTKVLIKNIYIFNGKDNKLVKGNILIEGKLIKMISMAPIATDKSQNTKIIDGQGKYVIP